MSTPKWTKTVIVEDDVHKAMKVISSYDEVPMQNLINNVLRDFIRQHPIGKHVLKERDK